MMPLLTLPHKIMVAFLAFVLAFTGGFVHGTRYGREATLKAAVAAYQQRERINHETDNLNPVDLCLVLGGTHHACQNIGEQPK